MSTLLNELMDLENYDLVPNITMFDCLICLTQVNPYEGIMLKECAHTFCSYELFAEYNNKRMYDDCCSKCLKNVILHCEEAEVTCPYRSTMYACQMKLRDREIRALVEPDQYNYHIDKSIKQVKIRAGATTISCKTPNCPGWYFRSDQVDKFRCPVCHAMNCLLCQHIHENATCPRDTLNKSINQKTTNIIQQMIGNGIAVRCPGCGIVITRKGGCHSVICSICHTENIIYQEK